MADPIVDLDSSIKTIGAVMVAREGTWWITKIRDLAMGRGSSRTALTAEKVDAVISLVGHVASTLDLMHQELRAMRDKLTEIQARMLAERGQ